MTDAKMLKQFASLFQSNNLMIVMASDATYDKYHFKWPHHNKITLPFLEIIAQHASKSKDLCLTYWRVQSRCEKTKNKKFSDTAKLAGARGIFFLSPASVRLVES